MSSRIYIYIYICKGERQSDLWIASMTSITITSSDAYRHTQTINKYIQDAYTQTAHCMQTQMQTRARTHLLLYFGPRCSYKVSSTLTNLRLLQQTKSRRINSNTRRAESSIGTGLGYWTAWIRLRHLPCANTEKQKGRGAPAERVTLLSTTMNYEMKGKQQTQNIIRRTPGRCKSLAYSTLPNKPPAGKPVFTHFL